MKKFTFFFCAVILLGICVSATTMVRRINIEQMTLDAQNIFLGKCVAAESGFDENGLPASRYTFEVQQTLKGGGGKSVTIKQFGISPFFSAGPSKDIPVMQVDGMPSYRTGNSYLLFMAPSSALGFSSPQGLTQGAFHAYADPATNRTVALNGIGNAELFSGVRNKSASRMRESSPSSDPQSPVLLSDLIQVVQQILSGK